MKRNKLSETQIFTMLNEVETGGDILCNEANSLSNKKRLLRQYLIRELKSPSIFIGFA
jgi:hypothetical protein